MTGAALAPAHLLLGPPRHGVRLLAEQVAAQVGAPVADSWSAATRHERIHLHLTDRLARAADVRRAAARSPVTVTLHDVPQPTDGRAFARRREAYRDIIDGVNGWAVSSHHERELVWRYLRPARDGLVAPLPVIPAATPPDDAASGWPEGPTVGVFGFVYPGKGHAELIDAATVLRRDGGPDVSVVAIGAVAQGHHDMAAELTARARAVGVRFVVTGYLDDVSTGRLLRRADVGVCGHRNVSASGSINSWVAAGRRPLVRDGAYTRELARLRPGCYRRYVDDELADRLRAALAGTESTWLDSRTDTRPHLADTARCYLDWWSEQ